MKAEPRFPVRAARAEPRGLRHAACVALLACIAAPAAMAQQPGQEITPNFRDTDIRQVIEAVQAVTGRSFAVDPRINAQVTLLSSSPMTPDAFYDTFMSILEIYNFAAVDRGNVTMIVPDADVRQRAGVPDGDDNFVTQTMQLENVGASQIVPLIRPMMPQSAHLGAHQASNMLILFDREANVERMMRIVARMDRAGAEDVEVIPLENASAGEIVRMLQSLGQTQEAAGGAPTVQVIADQRTNSVLLSGAETGRLRYRMLVAHLDNPTQDLGESQVRYLRYSDAEDLAANLQAQFGGRTIGPAGNGEGAPPGAGAAPGEGGVSIWADPGTNALVIDAPAPIMTEINAVIDRIDIRRAQVQVDAIIVEVSESKEAELGVTFAAEGVRANNPIALTNLGSGGIIGLASAAGGESPSPAAIPQGITVGVGRVSDTDTSWAALLTALRGDADTNIVSTPTVVTLDNEEAEIRVVQQVPFLTGQFTNTGANQGSVNPFQTIEREEVGTILQITPQINEGSGVKLTIVQETSSLAADSAASVSLTSVTNTREITTAVFVEDGDILVLGGLIDDQLRESEQRVPVLGRVPGLGWLFRSRSTERQKTNLMVFIRPRILRDSMEARFETNAKYNYMRQEQLRQDDGPVQLMRDETRPELLPLPDLQDSLPPLVIPEDGAAEDPDDGG